MDKYKVTHLKYSKFMVQNSRFNILTVFGEENLRFHPDSSRDPNKRIPNKQIPIPYFITFAENINRELSFSRKYLQVLRDAGFV